MPSRGVAGLDLKARRYGPRLWLAIVVGVAVLGAGCLPSSFDELTKDSIAVDGCEELGACLDAEVAEAGDGSEAGADGAASDAMSLPETEGGASDGQTPMPCAGECEAGAVEMGTQPCGACDTGSQMQTRTCSSDTCTWSAWSNVGACTGVTAPCAEGDTSPCDNGDSCGQRVCSATCKWSACQPKNANGCLRIRSGHTDEGSNYRCCDTGRWQFCMPDCTWSADCVACTEDAPNFCSDCYP